MYSYKENYLIHFGVPGMKWGQRKSYTSNYTKSYQQASKRQAAKTDKYRAKANKAQNKNRVVKAAKYGAKAAKAESKSKEYSRIAKKSAKLDKKISDRSSKVGSRIASAMLNGFDGNRSYDTLRVLGVSRGKAVVKSLINPVGAGLSARDKYSKSK